MPTWTDPDIDSAVRDETRSSLRDESKASRYGQSAPEDTRFPEERPYFQADERGKWYNTRVARQVLPTNVNVLACWIAIVVIGAYAAHEIRLGREADVSQNGQLAQHAKALDDKASKKDLSVVSQQVTVHTENISRVLLATLNDQQRRFESSNKTSLGSFQRSVQRQLNSFDERLRANENAARQQHSSVPARGAATPPPVSAAKPNPQYVIPIEPPTRDSGSSGTQTPNGDGQDKAAVAAFPLPPGVIATFAGDVMLWHMPPGAGHADETVVPLRLVTVGTHGAIEVRTQTGAICVISSAGQWLSCR